MPEVFFRLPISDHPHFGPPAFVQNRKVAMALSWWYRLVKWVRLLAMRAVITARRKRWVVGSRHFRAEGLQLGVILVQSRALVTG